MNKQQTEKIKLLLVEDDEDFSSALVSRLAKRDFEVTAVFSAEEALNKLKKDEIEVVVSDIKLPGMDGMEFLNRVREINENLPVILVTGYASLESAKKAVKLNAADYLLKPLEGINELLDPIHKAVHGYKLLLENKRLTDSLRIKINELKMSEEALKGSESKLREQKISLEQKNIALKEILGQIEIEKKQMKNNIMANIDKLLLPTLTKLRTKTIPRDAKYFDILQHNLEELISPFGRKITEKSMKLTPREIEICNMIKNGFTSKEISRLLNISLQTAERHRNNIRRKLDIVKKDINLTTYLQTF